jgi:uncharacterized OB-fold protein
MSDELSSGDAIREAAARIVSADDSQLRAARDPVNLPMIRNWIEAIDPDGPDDQDTAPPSMIQVWTMPGLHGIRADDDPLGQMSNLLDEAGYTSVVATNCDQEYHRYLKIGEQLSVRSALLEVTGPKRTALGEGWFVTTRSTWFSGDEPVATMDFRILKFRASPGGTTLPSRGDPSPRTPLRNPPAPGGKPFPPDPPGMRPLITPDTAFFWEGTAAGELRIQRCAKCGALRHPPGPMCPACGEAADGGYALAAGTGEVFSYVVHHHPPVPGKKLPMVVALVQLPEGVRILGEMPGVRPDEVRIGMPVRVTFVPAGEMSLPAWRCLPGGTTPQNLPRTGGSTPPYPPDPPARPAEGALPDRVIDVTPTFVISSALATRDFQDVHHDRDLAVKRGSRDIFINILTTTGLVQRYVSAWAPDAVVRAVSIRLGVPCHAGETLTLSGQALDDEVVAVTGRCSLGDHVTATVRIELAR